METPIGSVAGFDLARRLKALAPEHDLVLARAYSVFAGGGEDAGFLRLPDMPDLRLRVGPVEAMLAAANRKTRGMVRQCDLAGYRVRMAGCLDQFDLFYDMYYLPFVRRRHGRGAIVHPREILRRRLRRGGISWVELGGETLFAAIFEIADGTLRELVSGTLHGRYDAAVRRAQYASRAEHMRLARQAGVRWLNMGGGRPWLSDGMMAFKRAWGGELVERPDRLRSLLVGWRRRTPAVAAFLAASPLVICQGGHFGAVTAAPRAEPDAALAAWRPHAPSGLRHLYAITAGGSVAWGGPRDGIAVQQTRLHAPGSSAQLQHLMRRRESTRPGERER